MPRSFYRQLLIEIAMKQTPEGRATPAAEGRTREQVLAEREAKKLAKQAGKGAKKETPEVLKQAQPSKPAETSSVPAAEKSREEILAERAAKKQEKKQGGKAKPSAEPQAKKPVASEQPKTDPPADTKEEETSEKSKAELRAERRAKQEAQRAKKAEGPVKEEKIEKKIVEKVAAVKKEPSPRPKKTLVVVDGSHRVKLFAHLYQQDKIKSSVLSGVEQVHPCIARLGAQYRARVVCGSNVRCLALLSALKRVVGDYRTPANEELGRGLGAELTRSMAFLHSCRPVSVSMGNAVKHLRTQITRCKGAEAYVKEELVEWMDTYVRDQLEKAAEAISISVRQKIADGDVILTYSYSSLVQKILVAAAKGGIRFRVIVVDGRPWLEGRELLRRLLLAGIPCTYVLVNALSCVMPEVTKVLLGAHALLANGYVMSRAGSSQVALLARAVNVPVLVCCETHKFSERVQTDSFVLNELGNPDELLPSSEVAKWRSIPSLTPLNLVYDVTPPDLVSAVVTELAILPCTSVPVILRIK